jgi:hypothetical protein
MNAAANNNKTGNIEGMLKDPCLLPAPPTSCNSVPSRSATPQELEQTFNPPPVPASPASDQVTQPAPDCSADPTNGDCTTQVPADDASACTDPNNPTPCGGGNCCGGDYTPPTPEQLAQPPEGQQGDDTGEEVVASPPNPATGTPGVAQEEDPDPEDSELAPNQVPTDPNTTTSELSSPSTSCGRTHVLQCGLRGLQPYCRCQPLKKK